jgi:hypothetical protein
MKLSKKEKSLLIVFAVLVYAFVFTKFVLMSSIPRIKEAQNRIEAAKEQLSALEKDYNNIDEYKKMIEENRVIDERLGEYLMNSAGISDSIEFIENLALLIGTSLKSVSLGTPQQLIEGETAYYAFPISFNTVNYYLFIVHFFRYLSKLRFYTSYFAELLVGQFLFNSGSPAIENPHIYTGSKQNRGTDRYDQTQNYYPYGGSAFFLFFQFFFKWIFTYQEIYILHVNSSIRSCQLITLL